MNKPPLISYSDRPLAHGISTPSSAGFSPGTPTPDPTLNALTVTPSSATVGQVFPATVSGKTTGSVLSLTGAGSAGLSVSGTSITGTPTAAGAVNVVETLAGATGSPKTSAGVVTVANETVPFAYDAVKQYWHNWGSNDNVYDTLGTPTISVVRERIRKNGAEDIWQPNKAQQFLKTLDGGGHGNLLTNRVMGIGSAPNDVGAAPFSSGRRPKVTNGGNGWYFASVIKPETGDSWLMEIARAASSAASRGQCYVTSSRNLMLKGNALENATVNAIGNTTSQITFGNKIGVEYMWDFVTDTIYIKIGSVIQAITAGSETGPWSAFPSTDPMQWVFGNQSTLGKSFNGTIYETIFHDGVPTPEIQASVSAYVTAKAAA